MLYIFLISGTNHVKSGYTNGCPWARVRDGLWRLVHPEACCGKLGWEDLQLVALAPGTIVDEKAIQLQQPSVSGEFWHERDLEELRSAIEARVGALLPLPPKPDAPQMGRGIEKRPCCGGTQVVCFACHATFAGYVNLGTHRRESCPMRPAGGRSVCGACGKHVIKRDLKRHERACKPSEGGPSVP